MPTEENQTTVNPSNSSGSSQFNPGSMQSDNWSTNQNVSWENQKIDNLDIDLNLDWLDLPWSKSEDWTNLDFWNNPQIDSLDLWDIESNQDENILGQTEDFVVNNDKPNQEVGEFDDSSFYNDQNNNQNNIQDVIWQEVDNSIEPISFDDQVIEEDSNDIIEEEKDWLLEEDKKVEEVLKEDIQETWSIENEKTIDSVDNLDMWFFEQDEKRDNAIDTWDHNIVNYDINQNTLTDVNDNLSEVQLDSMDNAEEISSNKENFTNSFKVENLWENVIENNEWDIVSDTWELFVNDSGYVPNESDFRKATEILDSNTKWEVDISLLSNDVNVDEKTNILDFGQNIWNQWFSGWLNLDNITSNFEQKNETVEDLIHHDKIPENILNEDINQNNLDINNNQKMVENVVELKQNDEHNLESEQAHTTTSLIKAKKSHSGIKVFVLVVLLIVWWFMIFSKMYPEELKDIINMFNNKEQIEYVEIDNWMLVDEEEEDLWLLDFEDEDLWLDIDPDSLAGQLGLNDLEWDQDLSVVEDEPNLSDVTLENWDFSAEMNPFEYLDGLIENTWDDNAENFLLLQELSNYQNKWEEFYNKWRSENITVFMKYWLFISEKAKWWIKKIENWEVIDMVLLNQDINRFDVYISKLNQMLVENLDPTNWSLDGTQSGTWTEF